MEASEVSGLFKIKMEKLIKQKLKYNIMAAAEVIEDIEAKEMEDNDGKNSKRRN